MINYGYSKCFYYFFNAYGQKYCGSSFSANSIKRSVSCKYCDDKVELIIPIKIKFNSSSIFNILNFTENASDEEKCQFNSIILLLLSKYYAGWLLANDFTNEKCYGLENPKTITMLTRTKI